MHSVSLGTKKVLTVQNHIFPPKKFTPRIAKISHTARTTMSTFRYALVDPSRADTMAFIPEFLDINLRGLKALSILSTLMTGILMEATAISMTEAITMKKSS